MKINQAFNLDKNNRSNEKLSTNFGEIGGFSHPVHPAEGDDVGLASLLGVGDVLQNVHPLLRSQKSHYRLLQGRPHRGADGCCDVI